jgi:hypothetical protein
MSGKRSTIYSAASKPISRPPAPYVYDRQARIEAEWQVCHAEKSRLAVRAKAGKDWDGKAANDNINWPLAKELIEEGNTELLKYAIAYRRVYSMAKSEAVLGGAAPEREMNLDRYVYEDKETGETKYNNVRQRQSADIDIPATKKTPTDSLEPSGNGSSVPKPWNGDAPVNDMIDAKRKLSVLQIAVGSIVEPFEMMVVDNETLKAAGHAAGASSRDGASGAGRAIAHMGLIAVRDILGRLERRDLV